MPPTTPLPGSLHQRLLDVARRVRRVQALRRLSVLVLALSLVAGSALVADLALRETLPVAVRIAALAGWAVVALALTFGLLHTLFRRLDPADLAALIEQKYPELGERLTSSVELSRHADAGNGSPALIAILVQETEARTRPLDLGGVISGRSTGFLTGLAAVAFVGALLPVALAPQQYGRLAQRFFLPWQKTAPLADFHLDVEPGDTFAARGRPLAVSVHLAPRHKGIAPPRVVTLLVTGADNSTTKHEMAADAKEPGRYGATFRVLGDAKYRVEAGNVVSEDYTLSAITPVDLAPDNPTVTVTPPAYAASAFEQESFTGLVDIAALQHSTIRFRFGLSRPAISARLEWQTSAENKEGERRQTFPLTLSEDKTSAEFSLTLKESGSYRLLLEAERAVVTERDGGTLTAKPDQPPAVLKYVGQEGARPARPFDKLPIEVRLADDVAIASAELEYHVNDEKAPRHEPIAVEGVGSREAVGRHVFALNGKAKPGDEVQYRIRFRDNFPKEFGGPHVGYHPADGYMKLRIVADGGSLKEQDILSRRDAVNKKLDDIKEELKHEQRRAMKARGEAREDGALNDKTAEALADIRRQNQATEKALNDLAREMNEAPGEQKLAEMARDVARKEMRQADEGLRDAQDRKSDADRREARLKDTEEELNRAMAKLDRMREANEQLAQDRLDQAKVEALADRQKQLAEKAAELAKKDKPDAESKQQTEQMRREQEEVARELKKLAESSPTVQKALEEARAEQAKQAAEKARELAQAQRDLAKASDETEKARDAGRLKALENKQEDLSRKAQQLAKESAQPARANFAKPLQPEEAAKAAESLKRGEAEKAVQEQDRAAREMDRLARDLERGAEMAKDARTAARQLARLEEELAKRTREQGADKRDEWKRDQEAIRKSAENLSVPPGNRAAQEAKKKASDALAEAEKQLEDKNPKDAAAAMDKARQALRDLSAKLPDTHERQRQAREELAKLKSEQEAISRKAQEPDKQQEAAKKQGELAERLGKLDTPNAEARRDRAQQASKQAEADLREGRKDDVAKSQEKARRELDQLAQKMAGQKLPDEKAAELARRQEEIARKSSTDDLSKEKRDELRRAQKQLADETKALEAKGAESKKKEADDATRQANDLAKVNPTGKESRKAMADAAKKLEELAREMGNDSPNQQGAKALPSKEQAEAARKLAQEQRELREATKQAQEKGRADRKTDGTAPRDNPAAKLAREQADIAKDAAKLAKDVTREQGERSNPTKTAGEAERSAGEASRNLDSGALERAQKAGERSAEELRKLAGELAKTSRANSSPQKGDTLEQARKLAQRQDAVNKQLAPAASDPAAQRAQQQSRQEELTGKARELRRELDELGKAGPPSPTQSGAREAAGSARSAEESMRAARNQSKQGDQLSAQVQRERAARSLDQAAGQAEQAAKGRPESPTPARQAGRSMQEARGKMREAHEQMGKNQPKQAGQAMQEAGQSLERAAEQLAKALDPVTAPSAPPEQGAQGGGVVDTRDLPKELAPYSGKRWGELPGEVRTKVVQQMKARYGEDYARMIKLYFEQIADTKRKR